jgi:hypothetical protein
MHNTMNTSSIDAYEVDNKVFEYFLLLSDEAKQTGWTNAPPMAFSGPSNNGYSRSDFYTNYIQEKFLTLLEEKARSTCHMSYDRFTLIDDTERGLAEYYNVAKKGIKRIKVPKDLPEFCTMKFILDTARILLAYGLFNAKQFVPSKDKTANSDREGLDRYIVSTLPP